jgi:choline monooxygenase
VARLHELLSQFDPTLPLARARTIPASWYHDSELAALERNRVFGDTWQAVGRVDQVARPGDYFTADVAGEPVVVVRGDDGVLRAFVNVCRHRGARVACEEQGHASRLRCRYHGWTYDLSGRLRGTPEFDGVAEFCREDNPLPSLAVAVWEPFVWVHLGQPTPFEQWIAPLTRRDLNKPLHSLHFVARQQYRLACNWKVYVDNYLDGGYHVNTVHPGLASVIDYVHYRTEIDEHISVQISPLDRGDNPEVAAVRKGEAAYYIWIYPNFMINLYEGVMDTNLVLPEGANACRVIFDFYFADLSEAAAAQRQQSMQVAHQVQLEDIGICEDVQRGLASRTYDTGRFSVRREAAGYHFHQLLARHLRQQPVSDSCG